MCVYKPSSKPHFFPIIATIQTRERKRHREGEGREKARVSSEAQSSSSSFACPETERHQTSHVFPDLQSYLGNCLRHHGYKKRHLFKNNLVCFFCQEMLFGYTHKKKLSFLFSSHIIIITNMSVLYPKPSFVNETTHYIHLV